MKHFFTLTLFSIFTICVNAQWTPVTSISGWELNDISMVSATDGYIAALDDVYKTTNGGVNWSKISYAQADSTFYQNILKYGTHFFDKNTGVVVGYSGFTGTSVIIRTTNGGTVWDTVYTGGTGERLYAVAFGDANKGVAVGKGGKIVRTTDGGLTWSNSTSPTTEDLVSVDFNPGTNNVLACGYTKLLRSGTAGFSWTPTTYTGVDFRSVNYAAAGIAFACTPTAVLRTGNNGNSWFTATNNLSGLKDIYFVSADTGYACGDFFYRTCDAGVTWEYQSVISNQIFMYFYNSVQGFSGGYFGSYTRTGNAGGSIWKPMAKITLTGGYFCNDSILRFNTINKAGYSYNWYLNNQPISSQYSDSVFLPATGSTFQLKLVVSNGVANDTAIRNVNVTSKAYYTSPPRAVYDTICAGQQAHIVVDTPGDGATYRLYKNGVAVGSPVVAGTSILHFYYNISTTSVFTLLSSRTNICGYYEHTDSITVTVGSPNYYTTILPYQSAICFGDTARVMVLNSEPGVLYQIGDLPSVYDTVSGNGDTVYLEYPHLQEDHAFDIKSIYKATNCSWTYYNLVSFTIRTMTLKYNRVEDVYIGQDIELQNFSDGDSYEWFFGPTANILSDTAAQPSGPVSYSTLGTKTVTLVGHNNVGCLDTLQRRVRVFAPMDTLTPGQVCDFDTLPTRSSKITAYHVDRFGNHYVAGVTSVLNAGGSYNFGPSFYHYLQKFDTVGKLLWEYEDKFYNYPNNSTYYAAYISAITTDPVGNIYICGNFGAKQLKLMGTYTSFSNFVYPNVYIAKLNAQGNVQWISRSYTSSGGSTNFCGASDILYVDSAHIYIAMVGSCLMYEPNNIKSYPGNGVLQLNSYGEYKKHHYIGAGSSMGTAYNPYSVSINYPYMQFTGLKLLQRNDGKILAAGYVGATTVIFGSHSVTVGGGLYANGLIVGILEPDTGWVHAFTAYTGKGMFRDELDPLNCLPAICLDGNNNIYIAENFSRPSEYIPPMVKDTIFATPTQFHADSTESGCVMRYSPNGQLQWLVHTTAGDVNSLACSNDNSKLYLYGDYERFIGFTGASAQPIGRLGNGRKDAYLAALDSSGHFEWLEQIGGDSIDGAGLMVKTCGSTLNCLGYTNKLVKVKGQQVAVPGYRNFILKYDPTGVSCQKQTCPITDATYRTVYDTVTTFYPDSSSAKVYVKDSTTVLSNHHSLDTTHAYDTLMQITPVHTYDTVHYYSAYQTVDTQVLIYYTHHTDSIVYYDTVLQHYQFTYVDTLHIVLTIDTTFQSIGSGLDFSHITLIPNPVSTALLIQSSIPVTEVNIYSATGYLVRSIKQELSNALDISDLPAGTYVAEIKTSAGIVSRRWIKQ